MKLKILVSTIVSIMIWPASIAAQGELIPMIEIPAGNFYMGTLGEDENYMGHKTKRFVCCSCK